MMGSKEGIKAQRKDLQDACLKPMGSQKENIMPAMSGKELKLNQETLLYHQHSNYTLSNVCSSGHSTKKEVAGPAEVQEGVDNAVRDLEDLIC